MNILSEKISKLFERFEDADFKDEIKNELRSINDYAKALDDGALLVAIVGDVKAGKSTFCNLLANKSICQTDSKECTARPMFITNGDSQYRTYIATSGVSKDKRITFEQILSSIITDSNDEIPGIEVKSKQITEDSKRDSNENKDYFLTSFSVDSSDLVKEKIVFADLPGLNGSKFNFDEFQQILLSRADYIIFIQNSTTDITDSDIKVFNFIGENNGNVMVSVFMNLFAKSDYDENDNSREEAKDKLSTILNKGLFKKFINLNHEMSTVVNLGILESRRQNTVKNERKNDAENEYTIFREFIKRFTENVINKSDDIRKPNIEHNLNTRIQRLAKKVDDAIKEHENKINDYNEFA
ncbi:MAG: dynamin family protein, partial [Bacteroidales bacterium]|nr:dynamin family protein [Bacteroidales bacterium]